MENNIKAVYFIGAGGIGMSALERYFLSKGIAVGGYDRTESELSDELNKEGAKIHYSDRTDNIPQEFKDPEHTLIVYTPAIPADNQELGFFRAGKFRIMKRSQVLGEITKPARSICVAGTHGKTTTSSMIAHILKQSHIDCSAFLGGILKNYNSNLLLSKSSDYIVAEADEYDRSFHFLTPYIALITALSPDHLDIYGTPEAYRESFEYFTSLIKEQGILLIRKGINLTPRIKKSVSLYTYSGNEGGDFYADNIKTGNGKIVFDFISSKKIIKDIDLGVPVKINIENAVAAISVALLCGCTDEEIKSAVKSFRGAERRFDFRLKTDKIVLIDDYAHHPDELRASIESIKDLYPDKKLTTVFQPHLFTRTRDFYKQFASALSLSDEVVLLDIYPAREKPIEGVTSELILDNLSIEDKKLCSKEDLIPVLKESKQEVILMAGAGDIALLVEPVKKFFSDLC